MSGHPTTLPPHPPFHSTALPYPTLCPSATPLLWHKRLPVPKESKDRKGKALGNPHPMLDSFGCVSCFLLGIILCQDVNESHEIHLLLGSPWGKKPAMKSKYSPNSLSPITSQICFEKLTSLSPTTLVSVPQGQPSPQPIPLIFPGSLSPSALRMA